MKKSELAVFAGTAVFAAALLGSPPRAEARQCSGDNDHGCWRDLSGLNISHVDVVAGMACGLNAGNGTTNVNNMVHCYVPQGTSNANAAHQCTGTVNNTNNPFAAGTGNQMVSFTMMGFSGGFIDLYAVGLNGHLYSSRGNKNCVTSPTPENVFTSWRFVATNQDSNGIFFPKPHLITAVAPYQRPQAVYAVSGNASLYALNGSRWTKVDINQQYRLFFGDPAFALALLGTSSSSRELHLRLGGPTPDVPPMPITVNLDGSGFNFQALGTTQPFSLGTQDAWLAAAQSPTGMTGRNIYRTQLSNGAWSSWQIYDTGTLPASVSRMPWSVVDARSFRGARGELFAIGGAYHLMNYCP